MFNRQKTKQRGPRCVACPRREPEGKLGYIKMASGTAMLVDGCRTRTSIVYRCYEHIAKTKARAKFHWQLVTFEAQTIFNNEWWCFVFWILFCRGAEEILYVRYLECS